MNAHVDVFAEQRIALWATALTGNLMRRAIEDATDAALESGNVVVIVGVRDDGVLVMCAQGCCARLRGSLIVIPDVVEIELYSSGDTTSVPAVRAQRADGRSVALYRGGPAVRFGDAG